MNLLEFMLLFYVIKYLFHSLPLTNHLYLHVPNINSFLLPPFEEYSLYPDLKFHIPYCIKNSKDQHYLHCLESL